MAQKDSNVNMDAIVTTKVKEILTLHGPLNLVIKRSRIEETPLTQVTIR